MKTLLILSLSAVLVACGTTAKEKYPQGFVFGDHMYYWDPKVAHALWGSNAPKDPISTDWATTDKDGNVRISPQLAKKLRK